MIRIAIILAAIFLAGLNIVEAQTLPLRLWGEVVDADTGLPVERATLRLGASRTTSQSDSEGEFHILLRMDADTLEIGSVGYAGRTLPLRRDVALPLRIVLERRAVGIEDVTVVSSGYQKIPRERATGSYAVVDSTLWNQRIGTDILSRIEGIAPGVMVNSIDPNDPTIMVRGLSSLGRESMRPLIVLDNFPYEGELSNINPNDIASITVLKDAAAASIWGARAGNGVIVITTHAAGDGQGVRATLSSNYTYVNSPDLFSGNHMAVNDYIEMERLLYERGYYNARFSANNRPAIPYVADLLRQRDQGGLTIEGAEHQIAQLSSYDYRNDMQRYLYRAEGRQQYAAVLSGSSPRLDYTFSSGYDQNALQLMGDNYNRWTLRNNNVVKVTKDWRVQLGTWMVFNRAANNSPGGYGDFSGMSAYSRLADDYGNPLPLDIFLNRSFTDQIGNEGALLDWKYRPMQELALTDNSTSGQDIILNLGTNYSWRHGLSAEAHAQYNFGRSGLHNLHHGDSYYVRDLVNRFSSIEGGALVRRVPEGAILQTTENEHTAYNIRGQLNFSETFMSDHDVNAIFGTEIRHFSGRTRSALLYGHDPDRLTFAAVDHANMYPTYNNMFGRGYIPSGMNMTSTARRFVSFYGNGSYGYRGRYIVTGSIRRDASNLFGVQTNQKWNPLWSAGVMWHVHKESFVDLPILNRLSLRATYGYSGNIPNNATALTQINFYGAAFSAINESSATIFRGPNPSLSWEEVRTVNFGLDFSLLHNERLSGTVEYYRKRSTDVFNTARLDPIIGMVSQRKNSAHIEGHGVDVQVRGGVLRGKLDWQAMLLFSHADFKVTRNLDPPSLEGLVSSGQIIFPVEGYNPYLVASYRWAGLDPETGNPRGYLEGEISENYSAMRSNPIDEQVIHGPSVPPYFGALRNTFAWKAWSATIGLSYRMGHYFRNPALNYTTLFQYGRAQGNADFADRWQEPGDEQNTHVPSLIYPANSVRDNFYGNTEVHVHRASHIRLDELQMQYRFDFPKSSSIKALTCIFFANNLNVLVWNANSLGLDPVNPIGLHRPAHYSFGLNLNL